MKKFLLSLGAIALGLSSYAATVTFDFTTNDYGLPNDGETYVTVPATITSGDVKITLNGNENSWRMWTDGLREYYKNDPSFTVTTTNGEKVTSVSWTVVSGATFALQGTDNNISSWTGSEDAVTFISTASANKAVTSITVMYGKTQAPAEIITVEEALQLIEAGYTGEASVEGYIISIEEVSTQYGNATYIIADSMTETSGLKVFRGKYLNGESFTSEDQIEVGGKVVVKGNLTLYNDVPEVNSGNVILNYTAPGSETPEYTITNNINNLAVGDMLSATAVVTAQNTRGLILTDNAGSILYYDTNVDLSSYPIGTVVKVEGEVSA